MHNFVGGWGEGVVEILIWDRINIFDISDIFEISYIFDIFNISDIFEILDICEISEISYVKKGSSFVPLGWLEVTEKFSVGLVFMGSFP